MSSPNSSFNEKGPNREEESLTDAKPLAASKPDKREVDQFAFALVHEVRNPLSNINLAIEMINASDSEEEKKICHDIILRGSRRISDLMTELLVYYQSEKTSMEKYSNHRILDEVLEMSRDRIRLKRVSIVRDYSLVECMIMVNRQEIKIALTNIIINALEVMEPGKGVLKISSKAKDKKCVIEIRDNGIGIPKEDLKNIFSPNFSNRAGGLGLGLSTSQNIFAANHATIEVQSEPGEGTCFIISFDMLP